MRRPLVFIAFVAVSVACGLGAAGAFGRDVTAVPKVPCSKLKRQHKPLPLRCKKPKPRPLPPGSKLVATVDLNDSVDPAWIAADGQNVWVHGLEHVIRVDPASNAVVARIPTPPIAYGYMASGEGAVWQADFDDDALLAIDPASNTVSSTIALKAGSAPEGVGVTPGAVWVAEHHLGTVDRVDPVSRKVVATITVGPGGNGGPLELAAGDAGVWVNVPNAGEVVHIDPATNAVVGHVSESGQPIFDGNDVWVETSSGLDRIDPLTGKVIAHVKTAATQAWGAAGLGAVWVPTAAGLARIDEATNRLVGLLKGASGDVAITAGSIWLAGYGNGRLLRLVRA